MNAYKDSVGPAFLMCYVVYVVAMTTLDFGIGKDYTLIMEDSPFPQQKTATKVFTIVLFVMGLSLFIQHSGGINLWLTNAYAAQFNKRGAGHYFLLYSLSFIVLEFLAGQGKKKSRVILNRAIAIILLGLNFALLGSKLTVLTVFILIFAKEILETQLISKWSVIIGIGGLVVFIGGLVIRLGSLNFVLSYFFNYFDTLENFGVLLEDYKPDFFRTFWMPFLWPFIKMGISNSEFYDFSVWLTTEYTPDTWYEGQGTNQWNIESDMYLNYHFWGGIPLVILYFIIIAFLYKKAMKVGGIWQLIYIYEAMMIMSHLRGGLFIYWYWYLIPLYTWLILRFAPDSKYRIKD